MNKAIQLISTIENLGRLVEFIPGVKVYSSAEEDYSYVKISFKNNRDIVIIDLKRAVGNGMNFLQNVKITYFSSIVIVVTNLNNDDFRNRCFNHGADYFFDKETEIKEFSDVLNKQLKVISADRPESVEFA